MSVDRRTLRQPSCFLSSTSSTASLRGTLTPLPSNRHLASGKPSGNLRCAVHAASKCRNHQTVLFSSSPRLARYKCSANRRRLAHIAILKARQLSLRRSGLSSAMTIIVYLSLSADGDCCKASLVYTLEHQVCKTSMVTIPSSLYPEHTGLQDNFVS